MRKTYFALTILVSMMTLLSTSAEAAINWMGDLRQAQREAQQQQRPLLLHFYTDWCGPCRRLEAEVFPRPDVVQAVNSNYIPVKINAEKSKDIARQFEVAKYPTDVIVEPSGRVLVHTLTPTNTGEYIKMLNQVARNWNMANSPATSVYGAQQMQHGYAGPHTPPAGQMPNPAAQGYPSPGQDPRQVAAYQDPRSAGQYAPDPNNAGWAGTRPQQAEYAPAYSNQYNAAPPMAQPPQVGSVTPVAMTQENPYGLGYTANPSTPVPMGSGSQFSNRSASPQSGAFVNPSAQGSNINPQADGRSGYTSQYPSATSDAGSQPRLSALGLEGYCPVTLAEKESWELGVSQWGAIHRGRTYLFASEAQQQKFLSDPDRYSPILSGIDPTRFIDAGEVADGQRNHGMWFRGKMYLFSSEDSLQRFQGSPEYYAQRSREVMMRGTMRQ